MLPRFSRASAISARPVRAAEPRRFMFSDEGGVCAGRLSRALGSFVALGVARWRPVLAGFGFRFERRGAATAFVLTAFDVAGFEADAVGLAAFPGFTAAGRPLGRRFAAAGRRVAGRLAAFVEVRFAARLADWRGARLAMSESFLTLTVFR